METKYLKYILIFWVMLSTSACEDMLDTEVKSSITGQNYWKTENDFMPYLYSIYARNRTLVADNMIRVGEERGELWEEGYNNRFQFWDQNLTPGTTYDWTTFYGTIGHCNLLLEQIEIFEFANQSLKNQVKAEALALRANTYFFLARVWGDVPIVLNSVEDENTPLYPRSPVAEVFNQINSDIDESLELFPEDGYQDKYRFSKPSVYALQADVKMWTASVLGGGIQIMRRPSMLYNKWRLPVLFCWMTMEAYSTLIRMKKSFLVYTVTDTNIQVHESMRPF